ncbi:phosphotransferase [Streptomyces goshikiensis]
MDSFEINGDLVHSLARERHPDLAELGLREVPDGWDNQLWRLGNELAVRMPRTERAPALLRKEHRWLPSLAPSLPLPVPTPIRISEPSACFPRPWTIATWVPGEPADRTHISHDSAADTLAGFLKALHVKAPADAPVSQDRGVPLETLTNRFERMLEEVASRDAASDCREVRDVWNEALAAPDWQAAPVWLHGRLHPANVVVYRFFDAYADAAMIQRARGLAAAKSLILMGRAGERGLPGGTTLSATPALLSPDPGGRGRGSAGRTRTRPNA